ncbi:flagellar basal-body MS-ring/collar protein FliF [Planomicrobium sp. MB-3u-38]|uniref:flagellar basal-body MS-ring/collar protein FliF n=1 Tax=Planomicrobium sp. MB-3u-38 TaxID=2058318 RepID=UPI000C7AFDC3|nr:flagellar basal-body MS-ring/collar protein FliF [Planomicrobium sp. MB-3u-38]PKH10384.1 flagellar M-ring protein FliF [Planomicrobium sp. MB-3u-38]
MKEKFSAYKTKVSETWGNISPKIKWTIIGSFFVTFLLLLVFIFLGSRSDMTPLYSNLSPAETGEIKAAIESQGILTEVSADGKTISVPPEEVANLKVSLAAEGIPKNGNVNYSIFSDNMGLGMTDRHFDVVERDAMQNELAMLIRQIDGVTDANVMITLPKENVWLTDDEQVATASVVIKGEPSFQLDQKQVNGLYHLISKSVPSLPSDQIVIMDQNGQTFTMEDEKAADTTLTVYQQQRDIKQDIEKDIQKELQQMLGLLLGRDKVVVSVMASVDFTKEKREEQLVEPVNEETGEGIDISVERIVETYSSEGATVEDAAGTGDTEIANYPAAGAGGNSESERTEERINREVNRIHRQIELSPYVIDDITINVGVEPPVPGNPDSLTLETVGDIRNLLGNTVSAALSMNGAEVNELELDDRISVFATEFQGKTVVEAEEPIDNWFGTIPNSLLLIAGAAVALILIIGSLIFVLMRRKREVIEEDYGFDMFEQPVTPIGSLEEEEKEIDLSEFDSRSNPKRKTIEKLAKGRPEDFTKLLRTWMSEE